LTKNNRTIHLGITLLAGLAISCSDESQVEDLRSAQSSIKETENLSAGNDCEPNSKLNLATGLTYHSPEVQGVLMFCAGCHGQVNPQSGIDFSDYTRMITTFSQQNILLSRILKQVENDHQYSRDSGLDIITAWQQNQYARGSADGESDSPFFEGTKGDNGIDLGEFDPFAIDVDAADEGRDVADCP